MQPKSLRDFRTMGKTKCFIVGFCKTSRDAVPYNDPDAVIMGLNRGYLFQERADVWWEMHGEHIYTWQQRRPGKHMDWLKNFPGPVYMHRPDPGLPNSVAYPLAEVAADIGPYIWRVGKTDKKTNGLTDLDAMRDSTGEPYLSASIAYEIALAIYEGFEEIHLYGVDLNTDAEYAWQKPVVEFLLGVAAGRGIRVVLPDNCPLLTGNLYGRGYLSPEGERMSYAQLETRFKALQKQLNDMQVEQGKAIGGRQELDYQMQQMVPGIDHEMLDNRKREFDKVIGNIGQRILQLTGQINECAYFMHLTPDGQQPAEAIEQLRMTDEQRQGYPFASEGPRTDAEALLLRDGVDLARERNGYHAHTGADVAMAAGAV